MAVGRDYCFALKLQKLKVVTFSLLYNQPAVTLQVVSRYSIRTLIASVAMLAIFVGQRLRGLNREDDSSG